MKHLLYKFKASFGALTSKIAFYPTLIAAIGFFFALLMAILEKEGISRELIEVFPLLAIEDGDTVLTLLSACIGGLISLMVFSFSMVMLLLSQASSNFTPRLLPGLISNKSHQVILGIYLSTIIYNIFILFTIEPSEKKYTLPGLSILIGIALTILCLGAFIFFIHQISQNIQINNILDSIYNKAQTRLDKIIKSEQDQDLNIIRNFPGTDNWHSYKTNKSGYFQNISIDNIAKMCEENDVKIYITLPKGLFLLKNAVFIKSNKEIDEELIKDIVSNISFARGELVENNYALAFKQTTEIAVKAMSPGINDPGTAVNAIDYLTELFALRMKISDSSIIEYKGKANLKLAIITFKELLYNVMASLRTYCKHDPIMVQKMFWMLDYLKIQPTVDETYTKSIGQEQELLLMVSTNAFEAMADKKAIEERKPQNLVD